MLTMPFQSYKPLTGGFVAAGYTLSFEEGNMFIVKLDSSGNTCGNSTSPSSTVGTGPGTLGSPVPTVSSHTLSAITVSPTLGSCDTITTICVIGIQPISNEIPQSFKLYQNYPNPFKCGDNYQFSIIKEQLRETGSF